MLVKKDHPDMWLCMYVRTHLSIRRKQQQYLCSPKCCHPRVRWWELVLPLHWLHPERLPSLSTITPQGLRTQTHSAHLPPPRSKPQALRILDTRRERPHKEVPGSILVNSVCRIQTPTLQKTTQHSQSQQLCIIQVCLGETQ